MKIRYGWLIIFIVLFFITPTQAYFDEDWTDQSTAYWDVEGGSWLFSNSDPWDNTTGYYVYVSGPGTAQLDANLSRDLNGNTGYFQFKARADGDYWNNGENSDQWKFYFETNATISNWVGWSGNYGFRCSGFDCPAPPTLTVGEWYLFSGTIDEDSIQLQIYNESDVLIYNINDDYTPLVAYDDMHLFFHRGSSGGSHTCGVSYEDVIIEDFDPELPRSADLYFDQVYYDVGDTYTLTNELTNPDWITYNYDMYVYYPDGSVAKGIAIPEGDNNYSYVASFDRPGTWRGKVFEIDADGFAQELMDTAIASVSGTAFSESFITFDHDTYGLNYIAIIEYNVNSSTWANTSFGTSYRVYLKDQSGTVKLHFDLTSQNGTFNYMFSESGIYTVELRSSYLHISETVLAQDSAVVQESVVNSDGYGLIIDPTLTSCGKSLSFSIYSLAESSTHYFNVTTSAGSIIYSRNLTNNTQSIIRNFGNTSGTLTAKINTPSETKYEKDFVITTCYGSGNTDGIQPGSGFGDGNTYTSDSASTNAQQNFINFIAYPIFWGLLIIIAIVMVLALNHYGDAISYVVPVVVFFELVIGLLEPYTAFIGVAMVVFIVGMILIKQRS